MKELIETLRADLGDKLKPGDIRSSSDEEISLVSAQAFKDTAKYFGIKTLVVDKNGLYFEWNDHYFRLGLPEQIDVFVRDYNKDFQYRDSTQNPFTKEHLASFSKIPTAEDLFDRKSIVNLEKAIDLEEAVELKEVVDENPEKNNLRKVLTHPYTYGAIIIAYMVAGNMCN